MNYTNLILTLVCIAIFYLLFIKKENMSNTDIKKIISDVYQVDIQSIRNLSKLANDLTNNGQLIVPGGLTIKGNLRVDGHVGVKREPHSSVGLIVNGKGLAFGIETAGAGAYIDKKLLTVGNSELKGNVKVTGNLDTDGNTSTKKNLNVTGSSNFKNLVNIDKAELRIASKSAGTTHFNYLNGGRNYIRGTNLDIDTKNTNIKHIRKSWYWKSGSRQLAPGPMVYLDRQINYCPSGEFMSGIRWLRHGNNIETNILCSKLI